MTRDGFNQFVNALRFSYELRSAPAEIFDFWFARSGHIPEESIEWIRDRVRRDYPEKFPKHFHELLIRYFQDWLTATGKRSREPECSECDGGWVTIMEAEEMYPGTLIPVAYACNRCRQHVRGVKKLTKTQARRQGLILVDGKASAGELMDFGDGLKNLLAGMTREVGAS